MAWEKRELRWAVLGAGAIACNMGEAFEGAGRTIYAVGNRTVAGARAFAGRFGVEKVYEDFREMFFDPAVDVIYIATTHDTHIGFILEALSHGKHVLCEKSITLNRSELARAKALAEERGLVLAEAMTIFHMPVYRRLREIVSSGELGAVRTIQVSFCTRKEYDMTSRLFNKALAGGALLDIGVYALSFARCFLSSRPDAISSQVRFAPSGADEQAGILLTTPEGESAVISLSFLARQPRRAVVACDKGYIEVVDYPRADEAFVVRSDTGERETIRLGERKRALQYEVEDMERAILGGGNDMLLDLTTDVMDLMSTLRADWGMYYDGEALPL